MRIDLNADLGESPERWRSGEDQSLLGLISSANICCGAYAGDEELMRATCEASAKRGVAIGAQVGYPDRENFGRAFVDLSADRLVDEIASQIALLEKIATSVGSHVSYVKPHGALYNHIVTDEYHAAAVVEALAALSHRLPLLGLPGSVSLAIAAEHGIETRSEGFADRGYTSAGALVPRDQPGAVLGDVTEVVEQARRLLRDGVDSICIHSDSPGAVDLARAVRTGLEADGAQVVST